MLPIKSKKTLVASITLIMLSMTSVSVKASVSVLEVPECNQWAKKGWNTPHQIWLIGYLSGLSAANLYPKKDPLRQLNTLEVAYYWMDKYCKSNPSSNVSDGANILFKELAESIKKP